MNLSDILIISLLGAGIVFIGLILTSILIYSFRIQEKLGHILKSGKSTPAQPAVKSAATTSNDEISDEVLSVIATILEIELRIRANTYSQKFTFKSHG